MTEIEIPIPASANADAVIRAVDEAASEAALKITLRTTLSSFPGCTHWHLKRGSAAGTLEVTYWSKGSKLWFSVHQNRSASWIEAEIDTLTDLILLHVVDLRTPN